MNKMIVVDYRKNLRHWGQRLGLGDFLDWWFGELSATARQMLPGASKPAMERWALVKINGSLVTFSRVVHGKAAEQGRLDMASLDANGQKQAFQSELNKIIPLKDGIALCLPEERVLCKKLSLPPAAEENLRQVIAFEMDRHTPFNAGQVYFDYRLARRDKQLEISLAVAPRDAVDEPLRQLAAWGAQASAVLVAGDATDDTQWNLLPDGLRQKRKDTRLPRLNAALASGVAVLLCIALALPIWQKRETVLALQPLLNNAHEQAEAAENLRRQLEAMMAEYDYLLDKKRESPPVVAVLEDVTRLLPDDTWVQQFNLNGKEMQIHGETASSSKLAGLFEQAKTLHDASFRAPLTKGQGANSERFQLAAETRPLPRAETEHQPSPPAQPPEQPAVAQPAPGQAATPEGTIATDAAVAQGKGQEDKQP
ncbi:MAG: PilN domain-containing protein [Gallionella sp.]|nr:PilN domain-containing protein [Gallionella sp.]